MSSHIAGPIFPFEGRVEETHTVFSGGIFNYSLAAITLVNYGVTATSIKLASFFCHKDALKAWPYRCTNHDNHILSL